MKSEKLKLVEEMFPRLQWEEHPGSAGLVLQGRGYQTDILVFTSGMIWRVMTASSMLMRESSSLETCLNDFKDGLRDIRKTLNVMLNDEQTMSNEKCSCNCFEKNDSKQSSQPVWQMASSASWKEHHEYLNAGWEPFSVIRTQLNSEVVYFRKAKS